jgi:superfamily I DNA/RNA helicase
MKLTNEQIEILNSTGNIRINAIAGSGKTTTIIEYAKTRPKGSKILYLAFNRSVKQEAIKKFSESGLGNVNIETAHSLAYKSIVYRNNYQLRNQAYKTHEIAELLRLKGNGEKLTEYIVANHILKFITYFCNSDKQRISDLNYLDTVSEHKARLFVTSLYKYIENKANTLLEKMDNGEIEITHDFYLKKFQLSKPQLDYDYILFDEGQDASAAMLDVFINQKAIKVIVGDTHQQIYGWRHAVNSLEKVNFKTYYLSTSFRFGQDIANLATEVIKFKNHIGDLNQARITGIGNTKKVQVRAVLARSNLGLLVKAIEIITNDRNIKKVYFEGNINSYTYADEGASLYDVLNLHNGNFKLIKDKLIKKMKDVHELEDYIRKTEDIQLAMMLDIIKEYGDQIPGILRKIKEKHVEDNAKDKADLIFSTVHKSKGMEYDSVHIVNDFINEEKLEKFEIESKNGELNNAKLNEEINLLYVAITRTRHIVYIPETLMPRNFPHSPQIRVIKVKSRDDQKDISIPAKQVLLAENKVNNEKISGLEEMRTKHRDAYKPWTVELDDKLTEMYCEHLKVKDIAKYFGRTTGSIRSRIKKLELEELYG